MHERKMKTLLESDSADFTMTGNCHPPSCQPVLIWALRRRLICFRYESVIPPHSENVVQSAWTANRLVRMGRLVTMGQRRNIIALVTTGLCVTGYLAVLLSDVVTIRHFLPDLLTGYLMAWAVYGLLSTVSRAELLTRFLLTTSSIAGGFVIAEAPALLRMVDYRALLGSYESASALSIAGRHADEELLWQHDAYYQYDEPYQGNLGLALCIPPDPSHSITVRYDRHGFRNPRDLNAADIVVLGDSYIEGYMTPEAGLATTVLSQLQGKVVANLGHSGYGPQQELVVLKRYGLALHPQTVIWALFEGNDFDDLEQYDKQRARAGSPFWQNVWYRSLTRSALTRMLQPPHPCIRSQKIAQLQAHFTDDRHQISRVYFAPSEVQSPAEDKIAKTVAYLAEAARLCRERNIRFLVAFVPEKYRVYHNINNVELVSDAIRSWHVSPLPEEIGARLSALGLNIVYVDLTPSLQNASRMGVATYLPDDTHWTEAGNRLVAETLDRALRTEPPLTLFPLEVRSFAEPSSR
jgi:SGNH hydrolase-like domain, acetyltransferase AlgX